MLIKLRLEQQYQEKFAKDKEIENLSKLYKEKPDIFNEIDQFSRGYLQLELLENLSPSTEDSLSCWKIYIKQNMKKQSLKISILSREALLEVILVLKGG